MIYADTFIEKRSIVLRNLNVNNLNVSTGNQYNTTGLTGYGFYTVTYENRLVHGHLYYQRFTYKYTTTNKVPTWCTFYLLGGSQGGAGTGTISGGLVANQEYTPSAIVTPSDTLSTTSGTLYQGPSSNTSGVSGFVKEVLIYDVTELNNYLIALGLVTTQATLKTWCDTNLVWVPRYTPYEVAITDETDKVFIKKGTMIADEYIEPEGMIAYSTLGANAQASYDYHFFDTANVVSLYNNKGNGTVTLTRVASNGAGIDSPFYPEHPYVLKITTNGEATPGCGGFYAVHTSRANAWFIETFIAKIPVGYNVTMAYNSQGTGASVTYASPRAGTGNWEEYRILYHCGTEGSFSTGGHVYLSANSGYSATSVTWYLAYVESADITDRPNAYGFSVLSNKMTVKKGVVSTDIFDENSGADLIFSDPAKVVNYIPSNWSIDTSDYPTGSTSKFSIVQPVSATAGGLTNYKIKVQNRSRYKLSMWIKGKNDMTSYLAYIQYYNSAGTMYNHGSIIYRTSAKTQLTQPLASGDTVIHVKSSKNWIPNLTYGNIGVRANANADMNTKRLGINVDGSTDASTLTLPSAYSGDTVATNTYIVQSYDGATYYYPVGKGNIPTDNTWRYVEVYFGGTTAAGWDGASNNGWLDIPRYATDMALGLNIYTNTSSVPLKFADVKIEAAPTNETGYEGGRHATNIQVKDSAVN